MIETIQTTKFGTPSVLVVGAAGRTGIECIRSLRQHLSDPTIHAFCEDASKIGLSDWNLCTSVIEGSARHAIDIEEALQETKANWIVLCVGSSDISLPTNVRAFTAANVTRVLQKSEFHHVRVIVVSIARSIGLVNKCRLRYVTSDHKGQEDAIKSLGERATIVRSTPFFNESFKDTSNLSENSQNPQRRWSLTSNDSLSTVSLSSIRSLSPPRLSLLRSKHKEKDQQPLKQKIRQSNTKIVEYNETESVPSSITHRFDLAVWIANYIYEQNCKPTEVDKYGYLSEQSSTRIVNVTSVNVQV